jgi:D-psicose/D-tagatose/L-ribulose 3-epimerase
MNHAGIHTLVWTGSWGREQARRAIERTSAAGYDLLEIGCLDSWPVAVDAAHTRRLLEEHSLRVTGSLGLGPDTDITSPNPQVVGAGERTLRQAIDTVGELGGDTLCGILYAKLGKYDGPPSADGRSRSVEVLQRVADYAASAGMRLCLEVVNRYDSNLLNTAQQALEYIEDVGRSNVYVHLDTYHMNMEESDMLTPVLACGDRLGYVHLSESHRGYLGSGTVDFAGFFKALATIGYQGPLTFESFSAAVVEPSLSNLLGIWRTMWDDADDLARHARGFIKTYTAATARTPG